VLVNQTECLGHTTAHPVLFEVDVQTRVVVDLEKPDLQVLVHKHIVAEYLEHFARNILAVVDSCKSLLDEGSDDLRGLSCDLANVLLNGANVNSLLTQRLEQRSERSFGRTVYFQEVVALNIGVAHLVD